MERGSSRQGLLRHAASPCASDSSISSPRRGNLAGAGEEEEAVETMHGRRPSAAEEGGQTAHAGAGALGLRRALFPSGTAEAEEAPAGSAAAAQLGHELASPCASAASSRRETLAAGKDEGAKTTDDGGGGGVRLSAAEKGKQMADAADLPGDVAGVLRRPAPGPGPGTEIEEAPPSPPSLPPGLLAASHLHRNQELDRLLAELQRLRGGLGELSPSKLLQGEPRPGDVAMRHAGAVARHPLRPCAASEIEEAHPSLPPLRSRLLALNAARGLGAAAPAGLGGMVDELRRKEAALALLESRLQELRRERGDGEGASRCPGSEERAVAAEVQTLEHEMGTMHESLRISRDRMLALRLQEEEMQAYRESLKALKEFYKLTLVPQRKNTKISGICNWKLLVPVIAFANWLVLLVQFRPLHPVHHLTHIVGAIAACWMLGSIAFCCRPLGTSSRSTKGFRLHFGRLICACFLLLVVFVFDLILRRIGGTLAGLIGKHP